MDLSSLDYRGMIDASPNPYLVLDRDLHIAFANRAYLQGVKRDPADLVGRWAWEAFPTDPETERQAIASFERVKATGQPDTMALLRFDVPRPEAEGGGFEKRWWSITHSPVLDAAGEVALIVQHPIDVTDLERLRDVVTASGDAEAIDLLPAHTGIFARAQSIHEANLALKEESDRLKEMFAQAPSFMALLRGPEHVFEHVNGAYQRIISQRDVVGRPVREALPEVEGQGFVELLDRVYRTGEPFVACAMPMSIQGTPGSPVEVRVLDFVYQPITNRNGQVSGIFVDGTDVTDHLRADAALRESEELNRRILASSPDCIKVLDLDARLRFLSEGGMCAMEVDEFGAIEGRYWPDFWPGEGRARALAAVEEARRSGTGRFQGAAPTLKGTPRWWDVIVTPITEANGRPEKLLSISRDITATKQAEEALRDLNATLEARVTEALAERKVLADIVEGSTAAIMALGLDYTILAINEANVVAIEQVYDVRPKLGDNLLDLLTDLPEHRAQVAATWGRALAGEEFVVTDTFGDVAHEQIAFEIRFNGLRDREGRLIGASHTAYDISDRVRAQAELEQAQEALRQSQKMEAMGQLTGGVAHDFNNLLTPIIGSLDRLVTRKVGSEREQRLIAGALESAERAKVLVQRLLAFARRQPLQPVAVDVEALVTGMAGLIGSTLGPRVEMRVEVEGGLPPARADRNQLEMAILNLAVNARDAMPEGGRLTIGGTRASVRRGQHPVLAQGHYVRPSVTDTGIGMDAATRERAVEPFFSTKGIGRGTGLGLSMVYGLAAQLGGGLTIDSEPGQGTTVALWLPISADAFVDGGVDRAVPAPLQSRGSALLVDDEDLVRMSTADMLVDLGFDVREAGSAEEALRLLREGMAVDLLVTDHLMPGMSGAELAREVRALRPGVPVLIVSGYAELEGLASDLPRLVKPFRVAELTERVVALMPAETPATG